MKNSTVEKPACAIVAEIPDVLEAAERPVDIFDENFQPRPVERDAAGEFFVDRAIADFHVRDQNLDAVVVHAPAAHAQRLAQRHEFGIALDVGDELEHVLGGMAHPPLVAKRRHRANPSK